MTDKQRKADRYLLQIRNASRELTNLIDRIDYLRYKASGTGAIRYDKDHVQTSPEDMVCEALSEAVYLETKLTERHKKLALMRFETEKIIKLWDNNNARFIDTYYLQHGSMSDVARNCGCSYRHAYFIKSKALDEFYKHIQHLVP